MLYQMSKLYRNVMAEVKSFAPSTWTFLWDNFNKTHGLHCVIYGASNTHSVEVVNRAVLALRPPKICPKKTCQSQYENSCYREKERIPNEINFGEIYLNKHETNVKSKFTEIRSSFFWEKLPTYLDYSVNFRMSIIHEKGYLPKPQLQTKARLMWIPFCKQNFILRMKLLEIICLPGMLFVSWVKHYQNRSRIILPSVEGKDNNPNLAYEILRYGFNSFLNQREISETTFVGDDQKTIDIALGLKKQYDNFNQIYVTITWPKFPNIVDARST